jgi:hypothetical protein
MKRRAAVEPVIGHVKAEHRMGRNYLKGRDGDRINAVLAAAGYNFRTPPALAGKAFVRPHPGARHRAAASPNRLKTASHPVFTDDEVARFNDDGLSLWRRWRSKALDRPDQRRGVDSDRA